MAGNTANPRIWESADVYVAPVGTARPTNIATALSGTWVSVGLLSDETGMVEGRDEQVNDYYAWGNILVRTTRSKHKRTIKIAFLEDNPTVFGLVNPGSTTFTESNLATRTVKTPTANPKAWVIQTTDGENIRRRAIPRGEIIEVADITHSENEMTMYEATINVYPDSNGVLWYDISNDDQIESS